MDRPPPRVSQAIPACRPRFFGAALHSALRQRYGDLEIIVADDSGGTEIERIVQEEGGARVRYVRNATPLGFHGNFAQCFALARGEYVKFLNDDDLLHPRCVARMVAAFETLGPRVALVTGRRHVVDESGAVLADTAATEPLATADCTFNGIAFGDHVLVRSINCIGEPSAAMFRRDDVHLIRDTLFCLSARRYTCLADLALWLRLLARGSMAYLAQPLCSIRLHADQLQRSDDVAARCVAERVHLPREARALGFLADEGAYATALRHGSALVHAGLRNPRLTAHARDILEEALGETTEPSLPSVALTK
jgi:hypothetical protein